MSITESMTMFLRNLHADYRASYKVERWGVGYTQTSQQQGREVGRVQTSQQQGRGVGTGVHTDKSTTRERGGDRCTHRQVNNKGEGWGQVYTQTSQQQGRGVGTGVHTDKSTTRERGGDRCTHRQVNNKGEG